MIGTELRGDKPVASSGVTWLKIHRDVIKDSCDQITYQNMSRLTVTMEKKPAMEVRQVTQGPPDKPACPRLVV